VFYVLLLIILLAGGAITLLTFQNPVEVQLSLFGWQAPSLPLGILLLATFILGAVSLYIVAAVTAIRDTRELERLRQRVRELEQAQAQVLTPPLPGNPPTTPPIVPMPGITAPLQGPQAPPPQHE